MYAATVFDLLVYFKYHVVAILRGFYREICQGCQRNLFSAKPCKIYVGAHKKLTLNGRSAISVAPPVYPNGNPDKKLNFCVKHTYGYRAFLHVILREVSSYD